MNRSFVVIILTLILAGVAASRLIFSPRAFSPQNKFQEHIRHVTGKATPIREGVMTEKQKKHSKIFKRFEIVTQGKKLRDLAVEQGDVIVVKNVGDGGTPVNFNLGRYLLDLTCEADAVVVGTARDKSSQLIEEGTFVFTDYEIVVTDILKNNAAAPIDPNGVITFTSPGGSVELDGRVFRAVDYHREPLLLGEPYLLYLKFIPDSGAYKGFSNGWAGDTFQIAGDTLVQASKMAQPLGTKRKTDAAPFLAEARLVTKGTCNK